MGGVLGFWFTVVGGRKVLLAGRSGDYDGGTGRPLRTRGDNLRRCGITYLVLVLLAELSDSEDELLLLTCRGSLILRVTGRLRGASRLLLTVSSTGRA